MTDIAAEIYKYLPGKDLRTLLYISKLSNITVSKVLSKDIFYDARLKLLYSDETMSIKNYRTPDGLILNDNLKIRSLVCRMTDLLNLCESREEKDNEKDLGNEQNLYVTI